MSYRAPVADIAFTLRACRRARRALIAGRPLRRPRRADLRRRRSWRRPAASPASVLAPLNRVGDRDGATLEDGAVTTAPGLAARPTATGRRPAGTRLPAPEAIRRPGPAACSLTAACIEMWNSACMAFGLGPLLTMGAIEALDRARLDGAEGDLSRQARLRRMDRHDEPDRAAGRLRPRRPATARRAGRRRHLPHHRPEDLHHLRRARPDRQHRPSGAGAPARRAARHARHLAVPGAEVPRRRRRHARRAQRRASARGIEHKLGIHGSPTCTMVYGDDGRRRSAG